MSKAVDGASGFGLRLIGRAVRILGFNLKPGAGFWCAIAQRVSKDLLALRSDAYLLTEDASSE